MSDAASDDQSVLHQNVEEHGVRPVLLDGQGGIIDGYFRQGKASTYTLALTTEQGIHLRHALTALDERWTAARRNRVVHLVGQAYLGQGKAEILRKVTKDFTAMGLTLDLSSSSVDRIVRFGDNNGKNPPLKRDRPVRMPRRSKRKTQDPRVVASNASMRAIRRDNEINQYESMMNAPAGKLNNPLIRKAEQLNQLLVEISALDPEVAITQIPIERCRQWQPEFAEWWLRFTQLCEERRVTETPDVPPQRYRRRTPLLPPEEGQPPTHEDQLSAIQSSILAWLRTQDGPRSAIYVGTMTKAAPGSTYSALETLISHGLVRKVTGDPGMPILYVAVDTTVPEL